MPYYYDITGIIILIPAFIFALFAQNRIRSTYAKYSQVHNSNGYTGAKAARIILDQNGLYHVLVQQTQGVLSDHYDPKRKIVFLSQEVYNSSSIASVGIAAHECGHAVQHDVGYSPLTFRNAIIPLTNIGSNLAIPLLLIGFLFNFGILISIGLIAYSLMAVFQLATLPVEFNASARALSIINEHNLLLEEEARGAKKVLNAAALTYVAALLSALSQLLRIFLISSRRRRR